MRKYAAVSLALWLLASLMSIPALAADWQKFQSEHFEIFTRESRGNARQVLQHLEQVRAAYQVLTNTKAQGTARARVVLLKNRGEYQRYAPSATSEAYYTSARGVDYIVLFQSDTATTRVLNHEYFHLFSRHAEFQFPPWLEEGFADFFSTLKITNKEIHLGLPVENHLRYLNAVSASSVPLARIFSLQPADRHQSEKELVWQLYAKGWALTHMTFLSGNMRSRSGEFLAATASGADPAEVYQEVYGASLKDLDMLLGRYIQQSAYHFIKVPATGLDQRAAVVDAPIAPWESTLLLGQLHQNIGRTDEAVAIFEDLARQYPQEPAIAEAQGYLALRDMDRETAASHFRRAAEAKSTSPDLYFDLAQLSCNYSEFNPDCQRWINEALRLKPTFMQARKWAVGYVLNARKFDHALVYLARAGTVKPGDAPDYFYQYAHALAGLKRMDEARGAIRRGMEFAKTPVQIARFRSLELYTEASVEYRGQQAAFLARMEPPAPQGEAPADAAASGTEDQDGSISIERPYLKRAVPTSGPSDAEVPALDAADTVTAELNRFLAGENAILTAALAGQLDCRSPVTLTVEVRGKSLRLMIDDPQSVRVFLNGAAKLDHAFNCGSQNEKLVIVGYITSSQTPPGIDGVLRILSFE